MLEIKHLSAGYEGEQTLHDINLTMQPGEILCIVGESGSGKSSLIRAITGYKGLQVTEGSICFGGQELMRGKRACANGVMGREIGLIPQNPEGSFNPIRTFEKQFREMFASHGMSMEEAQIEGAFETVGLQDYKRILKSRPYEMSGGMNQRIAIAAAMLLSPKLLICDEATSALDVTTAQLVMDELLQMRRDLGTGILMVTHNLGIAKHMADRIAIMYQGELVEIGPCQDVIDHPQHAYTKQLLESAPRMSA
ncbi:MAG: ABC transporter ATP-binding protein [Lachnospiraceae bacterium]|nr:ABC transporter ATP-binding protein [Lachnospiraceae bacterium]